MVRYVVDTSTSLHKSILDHWKYEEGMHKKKRGRMMTRFERMIEEGMNNSVSSGDELVARVREVFHHGLGIEWGTNQIKIFETFLFATLPLLYGDSWQENKARVLAEWGKKEMRQYVIVSMARRNGKTFVSAGAIVALLIAVPKVKLVIFSTCKRTSQLMMGAVDDMIQNAFTKGTHINSQDYIMVSKNSETICFEAFGTKRTISCLPVRSFYLKMI